MYDDPDVVEMTVPMIERTFNKQAMLMSDWLLKFSDVTVENFVPTRGSYVVLDGQTYFRPQTTKHTPNLQRPNTLVGSFVDRNN